MGVEKKSTSFRLSEETLMQIDQIKRSLHPFCEDRSSTLRIIVSIVYAIIFTPTTLRDVVEVMQRVHRGTSCDEAIQLRFSFYEQPISFIPKIYKEAQ